ncbi:tetratricopeptide repeat protein [Flavicella sp.]|uniref:tetratricopeptide repeat protein n=1 Tax=Flavicella sp. TaxID=2957742 RepID=UPI003019B2B8
MKNKLSLLIMLALSVSVFAQKKELKEAEKSLKKKEYTAAIEQLKVVEPLLENAKDKLKQKYYYLKAKSIYGDGENRENTKSAAIAFKELIAFEKKIGSDKYLNESEVFLSDFIQETAKSGSESYGDKNYKQASIQFEEVYMFSKKDTSFLDNAALSAYYDNDYDRSIMLYKKLLELEYTGIFKKFRAKNVVDNEYLNFGTKVEMDRQVLMKVAIEPEVIMTKSRTGDIAKNIALSYIAKGDDQAALDAIAKAKKSFPNDYTLVISEANIYYKLGDNEKFLAGLKEAISIQPNDPQLYYNVGVITLEEGYLEESLESFKKAVELKPDYADAYNNIGVVILEKTKPIIDEMNENLSNFKKYDELYLKQKEVYKEALPYFEKSLELQPNSEGTLNTLVGLYELLEMYDKQKETTAKIDSL